MRNSSKKPARPRRTPNKTERLAAVLLMLKDGTGEWLIPEPLRTAGTAEEICSHVEWDHARHYALGGTCDPRNLTPLSKAAHKEKTNRIDKKAIAKSKRIEGKQAKFTARMSVKATGDPDGQDEPKRYKKSWPKASRPWPKRKFR